MTEELTAEENAILPVVRDEWIDLALNNPDGALDEKAVAGWVDFCYKLSGLEVPRIEVATSTRDAQRRAQGYLHTTNYVETVNRGLGRDSGWLARYDCCNRLGIEVPDNFTTYKNAVRDSRVWDAIFLDEVAIVIPPPCRVARDDEHRLHCDHEAALQWKDGYQQHYLQGVYFEEDLWTRIVKEELTIDGLAQIENADQNAVAVFMLRPDRLLAHAKAELIDTGKKGTRLYRVDDFMSRGETEYPMLMTCPSTGREFIEWANPEDAEQGSADLCQAVACGLTLEEYLEMDES